MASHLVPVQGPCVEAEQQVDDNGALSEAETVVQHPSPSQQQQESSSLPPPTSKSTDQPSPLCRKRKREHGYSNPPASRVPSHSRSLSPNDSVSSRGTHPGQAIRKLKDTDLLKPNARDRSGQTLLFRYVQWADPVSVEKLLQAHADPNISDNAGTTPLHVAALNGYADLIQLLVKYAAKVSIKGDNGDTPLHDAAQNDHVEAVKILLDAGANPLLLNDDGQSPVDVTQNLDILHLLRERRDRLVKVNSRDKAGQTPLHRAANSGNLEEARQLLENGAHVNAKDNANWTSLHEASLAGHVEMVKLLLKHGADVDSRGLKDDTALHDAAANGHSQVVETLLEHHADPRCVNSSGETPLDVVNESKNGGIGDLLRRALHQFRGKKKSDASLNSPPLALDHSNHEHYGKRGRSIHTRNDILWLDHRQKDAKGRTHLHKWALEGDIEMVGRLLEGGASPNVADIEGRTPLHLASRHNHVSVVEFLLAFDADPNCAAKDGNTPLHDSVGRGQLEVVKLLILNKANPTLRNRKGETAIQIATCEIGSEVEEVKYLRKSVVDFLKWRDSPGPSPPVRRPGASKESSSSTNGIDPPKRKRGRPKKNPDAFVKFETQRSVSEPQPKKRRLVSGKELAAGESTSSETDSPARTNRERPAETNESSIQNTSLAPPHPQPQLHLQSPPEMNNPLPSPSPSTTRNFDDLTPLKKTPKIEEFKKFLPLYVILKNGEKYIVDIHLAWLFNLSIDQLYSQLRNIASLDISKSEQSTLWMTLNAMACYYLRELTPSEALTLLRNIKSTFTGILNVSSQLEVMFHLQQFEKHKFEKCNLHYLLFSDVYKYVQLEFPELVKFLETVVIDISCDSSFIDTRYCELPLWLGIKLQRADTHGARL